MKRFFSSLNSVAAVVLAFVLVLMINFIALTNPVRSDWSSSQFYMLSDKTTSLLQLVDEPLDVIVISPDEHEIYHEVENLLEEYTAKNRQIHVRWVDPHRDLAKAEALATKYELTVAPVIVFVYKDRHRVVTLEDFASYAMVKNRKEPVLSAFKGEQAFSSAIQGLLQDKKPVVYFLMGHNERQASDFEPQGYSSIGQIMVADNLELRELHLVKQNQVPDDAAALIIAGPSEMMNRTEAERIEEYLNRSGRVLLLMDSLVETGLEDMVRRWGVLLRNDFVVDPKYSQKGGDVYVRDYSPHEITAKIARKSNAMGARFYWPRSIEPLDPDFEKAVAEDRPVVIPLVNSSEESWSETSIEQSPPKYDENSADLKGSFSLAVAVERGASQTALDVQIKPSRMVVFGDSDFVSNGAMAGGDQDLFMSSVNWLLSREEMMAIAPKPYEKVTLSLTRAQLIRLLGISAAGIPSVAVVAGLVVWFRRRK